MENEKENVRSQHVISILSLHPLDYGWMHAAFWGEQNPLNEMIFRLDRANSWKKNGFSRLYFRSDSLAMSNAIGRGTSFCFFRLIERCEKLIHFGSQTISFSSYRSESINWVGFIGFDSLINEEKCWAEFSDGEFSDGEFSSEQHELHKW